MLTKKDYIKIVSIFNRRKPLKVECDIDSGRMLQHLDLIDDFINWLIEDNPDFNEDKFYKALNLEINKMKF